jgi:hypothetical protein
VWGSLFLNNVTLCALGTCDQSECENKHSIHAIPIKSARGMFLTMVSNSPPAKKQTGMKNRREGNIPLVFLGFFLQRKIDAHKNFRLFLAEWMLSSFNIQFPKLLLQLKL